MICEGSGFPEGDSANAPDFITGRFHDRTYAKIIIILENDTMNQTVRDNPTRPRGSGRGAGVRRERAGLSVSVPGRLTPPF